MYIPSAFNVDSRETLHAFMRAYSFVTLVTGGAEPFATHLPLLLDSERGPKGTLIGHFARPNPHWEMNHEQLETIAIFHGPHAYVSPTWYRSGLPAVPTWNYAAVHAIGRLEIIEDAAQVAAILERTVQTYESGQSNPWTNQLPEEMNTKLVSAVVGFEMMIDRLEGKFKLGQNRKREDQIGVIEGLEAAGDAESVAMARFARKLLDLQPAE